MKKALHTTVALVLVFAFTFVLSIPAFAAEDYKGNILGSYADEDNPIEAGLEVYDGNARSTWQLFTMSASSVANYITTKKSNKSFKKSDLTHGGLLIQGYLSYTVSGTTYPARAGVCSYTSDQGLFVSELETDGNAIYSLYDKSQFSSKIVYYGFIASKLGSSTDRVSGRLTFYDTNE